MPNSSASHININRIVDHLFREEAGKLTAILIRRFGFENFELIEDIVQETFWAALKTWPSGGIPDNPSGWLMQVAKNKTLNAIKKEKRLIYPEKHMADIRSANEIPSHTTESEIDEWFLDHHIRDSQLRVLLTCCHPSYPEKARIMLALKTLAGFSYSEISQGLLANEENVRKSLYRIRKRIRKNEEILKKPVRDQIPERLDSVLTVLYLMFNEGYKRTDGDEVIGEDLCFEAMRLTKLLNEMLPDSTGQINALMALMCLNAARFPARSDPEGHIIDLKGQDRSLWDRTLISQGFHYLKKSRVSGSVSRYHLEAGISSVHCTASTYEETDWEKILFYYNQLLQQTDNSVIKINRAIALSYIEGAETGLEMLELLSDELAEYNHLYHAARADMYYRLGLYEKARSCYETACDFAKSQPDKQFLMNRLKECTAQIRAGNSIDFPNST